MSLPPIPTAEDTATRYPKPTDYWHNHYTAVMLVLDKLPNGNFVIVTERVFNDERGQHFNLNAAFEATLAELQAVVGRHCSVLTGETFAIQWVREWHEKHASCHRVRNVQPDGGCFHSVVIDGTEVAKLSSVKRDQLLDWIKQYA